MLERFRTPHISLAAKCQILFGAAVVLSMSAALFVPWQRMEELTDQLNERAAAAVARTAVAEHVFRARIASTQPSAARANLMSAARGTTQPSFTIDGDTVQPPRLVSVEAAKNPTSVTRFEAGAMQRFSKDPNLPFYSRTYLNRGAADTGYRYAQPLFQSSQCASCHGGSNPVYATTLAPTTNIALARPAREKNSRLLGLVSVDIASQISTRQMLLNRVFILTAGLIGGTLAVVIFYLVTSRLILRPMRVLQETAEKVSRGDLNIRSDINSGDEFQVLSETLNTMLTNLKDNADQLRAVNKSLDLKLGQMAESNVALFESNRLKSEFLANVSHELRTPLNSILGFTELLGEVIRTASAEAKAGRYVQNILHSGHELLDLINDLLDLAKIEAGRMDVRAEPLSLADLFEALGGVLKPLTEAKRLTIVPSVAPDVPIIETDPAKLQQILYNFLSNAIKFSPNEGRIMLAAVLVGERVRISVSDSGPGIDPAQHSVIFEKFRQLDGSVTRAHSGTGLGLAISRELTILMGGTIGLESEAGAGSTFYIVLPLRITARQADVRNETASART